MTRDVLPYLALGFVCFRDRLLLRASIRVPSSLLVLAQ